MTTGQDIERVARQVYGPAMRVVALHALDAITKMRQELDLIEKQRDLVQSSLALIEHRINAVIENMEAA